MFTDELGNVTLCVVSEALDQNRDAHKHLVPSGHVFLCFEPMTESALLIKIVCTDKEFGF